MMTASTTPQTVDVIAPSDLNAGYQFQVDAQGQSLTVQVPPGGAKAGQRFSATVLQASVTKGGGNGPPTGHWRDEWTNCCSKIDAMCCLGFWCSTCLVGQIMTRLNLDWKGDRFTDASAKPSLSTFKIVFIITLVYHVLSRIFSIVGLGIIELVFLVLFAVYFTLIGCKTRNLIRRTYNIPTSTCDEKMEDCCCAFWCSCCTACHMARHLTDYTVHKAECCTDTGLGHDAPVLSEFAIPSGAPMAGMSTTVGSTPPPVLKQSNSMNNSSNGVGGGVPTAPQEDDDDTDRRNEETYMVDV